MKEAGLNYLVCNVPRHSILLLVTSDGQVELRDMLNPSSNELLTDEMIRGQRGDSKPLTVADIVAFSQKPSPEGLMFDIVSPKYWEKFPWIKENQSPYAYIFEPEYGHQIQILINTGSALAKLFRWEEAVEAYRQAIALDLKFAPSYRGLGFALYALGRWEEAVEAFRNFIDLAYKEKDKYWIEQAKQKIAELTAKLKK